MKKGRIILTMVAFAFAIVSAFASHFEKTPLITAYGVVNPAATCTDGLLTTANINCLGNSDRPVCRVQITIGVDKYLVPAFAANGSPYCVTPLYRTPQ